MGQDLTVAENHEMGLQAVRVTGTIQRHQSVTVILGFFFFLILIEGLLVYFHKEELVRNIELSSLGFPGGSVSKECACNAGEQASIPGSEKILWRRKWQRTPVFLPGEFHGQRAWWAAVHGLQRVGHD